MTDPCEATGLRAIAIDGKACRAAAGDTFLGRVAVAGGSNEIAAVPALLRVLDLEGARVTLDAAFSRKAIVEQVREQGGDYLVTVKGNQPAVRRTVRAAVGKVGDAECAGCDTAASVEGGHGRHEERYVTALRDPDGRPEGWADVSAVAMVGRERVANGGSTSRAHVYLTSLRNSAKELAGYVRGH